MDAENHALINEEDDDKELTSYQDESYISSRKAGDSEKKDKENDGVQLSDSIFIYPNKKISDHANVFEGEIRSGVYGVRVCAIKFDRKSERNIEEARILAKLASHTHIVSIIQSGIHHDMFEDRVYIALDKCHKHNLRQHFIHQRESGIDFILEEALQYSKQIIDGVTYVHENLIIHKDLKPSNILLSHDKSTIKLADFGLSQEIKSISSKVYCKHQFGTHGFRPLESFGRDWASLRSDTFSLGAVLYFLLSNGKSLFGEEITLWIHKTRKGEIDISQLPVPNAKTFRHLLTFMLSTERCRRPSIWQVAEHPCWTGSHVDCDFDYGLAEEIDDCDVQIYEPKRQDSVDSEKGMESNLHLIRALEDRTLGISRKSEKSIIIFDRISEYLHHWNPKKNSVRRIHEFNDEMKKKGFSSVYLDNRVYVLTEKSVYRLEYDNASATWEKMSDLNGLHGSLPPAVVVSGSIYIIGSAGGRWSKEATKYDPSLNKWEKLRDKKMDSADSAIVHSNGFIYSIGGYVVGFEVTDRVERFNVVLQTWDEVAPMNERREGASAVECKEKIIVAGGADRSWKHLNSVEKYDPDVNQWTTMKPMIKSRSWFRLHMIEGGIFAFGGVEEYRTIEKYDSTMHRWNIFDLGPHMRIYETVTLGKKN